MASRNAIPGPAGYPYRTVNQTEDGWEQLLFRDGRVLSVWPEAHCRGQEAFSFVEEFRSPFWPLCSAQDLLRLAWSAAQRREPRALAHEPPKVYYAWVQEVQRLCGVTEAELEAELALCLLEGDAAHG